MGCHTDLRPPPVEMWAVWWVLPPPCGNVGGVVGIARPPPPMGVWSGGVLICFFKAFPFIDL